MKHRTHVLYALTSDEHLKRGEYKVGISEDTAGVGGDGGRLDSYNNGTDDLRIAAIWDIGMSSSKSDKFVHSHFSDRLVKKHREWIRNITLEEIDEYIMYRFLPDVTRIQ
jgi:hypothetical protein